MKYRDYDWYWSIKFGNTWMSFGFHLYFHVFFFKHILSDLRVYKAVTRIKNLRGITFDWYFILSNGCSSLQTGWWFQTFGLFSISYMGCHPSHWRTPSFFNMVKLNHQPASYFDRKEKDHVWYPQPSSPALPQSGWVYELNQGWSVELVLTL